MMVLEKKEHIVRSISTEDWNAIWGWNAKVPKAVDALIHDLISKKTYAQSDAPAVCAWDGDLTYGELERLTSRLANHLLTIGIEANTLVPLCFEKSKWTVVAILGVLKAQAGFVLLDPTQPLKRMQSILQQIKATHLLTSPYGVKMLEDVTEQLVVLSHETTATMIDVKVPTSLSLNSFTRTLYVVFTSGSTGVPKGVVVTHGNFATAYRHQASALGFDARSRVFDFSSYSFEVTIHNTLATLCAGGCVCIPSEDERRSDIASAMEKMNVNLANFTPTVSRLFTPKDVPSLKILILIGEPILEEDGKRWSRDVRLINAYGPAECTMLSTANLDIRDWKDALCIGSGLGAITWVVDPDDHNVLLSLGAVGELLIEGPIVGAGYLHNAKKTKEAFISNPNWLARESSSGVAMTSRLYKTGDLVRYDSRGALNFVGRRDNQVKIRGQRIELNEVESHVSDSLLQIGVEASVVVEKITPIGKADALLAAFVSLRANQSKPIEAAAVMPTQIIDRLEDQLLQKVPLYMVPTAYIPSREHPTTASGKTDRRRLRELGNSMTMEQLRAVMPSTGEKRPPESHMERTVQVLWAEILGLDRDCISASDSFLRLGGDSIRAMRLVGAAREQGLSLDVATILKHPYLHDLATQMKSDNGDDDIAAVQPFSMLKPDLDLHEILHQVATLCDCLTQQIENIFPCTPLQEGLIAMTAKNPGDYIDRLVFALDVDTIDLDRLQKAWQDLARDAPILRTRIVDVRQQGLVQVVIKEQLSYTKARRNLQEYMAIDRARTTGLDKPLNWLAVVQEEKQCFLVWTIHHALYDAWSLPAMLKMLGNLYHGALQTRHQPFHEFVQHTLELEEQDARIYWTQQMADCTAVVFPELPQPSYEPQADGVVKHFMQDLHWPRDITASTVIRAAWSLLIARYTDSNDVLFGATVTGRQAAVRGIENMLGPTIVTVPVRILLDWNITVEHFLQQIQIQALDMIAFEQTGLQKILRLGSGSNKTSQFQTLVIIQPPEEETDIDHNYNFLRPVNVEDDGVANFGAFNTYAMTAMCQLSHSGLELQIGFDSGVVSKTQVNRFTRQLEFILRQLCVNMSRSLGELDTVTEYDLGQVWEWNAKVPLSIETCVHDLIMSRAEKQPSAPAICAWNGELTYAELNTRSTQLAHYLIELGASGQTVPLCFEKSVWTPIAMLAVMKAGATSIALDITMPKDRLRAVLRQVEPKLALSSTQNEGLARELLDVTCRVVVAEGYVDTDTNHSADLPKVDSSLPVYIVFTSGSTGTPKGVILSHGNLSSAISHQKETSYIDERSRVFDFASYAFDMAWVNFLKTAVYGGCLCIPSEIDRKGNLADSMNAMRVNFAHLTPGVARLIKSSVIPSLAVISQGGEPLLQEDVVGWGSSVILHTGYGPAECTPSATLRKIKPHTHVRNIGRGQGLLTWVVCTDREQIAPIGAIGELWLEGPLVGQGYLKYQEQTERSFVENPTWLLAGTKASQISDRIRSNGREGRLYRTGDLVRYDEDGSLIFVGRRDSQVKIRGQRVELSEVAHHVRRSLTALDIAASVITEILAAQESDSARLVAFLDMAEDRAEISEDDHQMTINTKAGRLDDILAEIVPEYMIPSAYIVIKIRPVTVTGKTDRRRLREMGRDYLTKQSLADGQRERLLPTSQLEKDLQEVWADVLNVESASIFTDSVFTGLGGDSITAMQVVSRCRARNIAVAVGDILRLRTIQKLSSRCKLITSTPVVLNKEEDGQRWALSPVQSGFFDAHPQGLNHFNQNFMVKLKNNIPASAVASALESLIARHPMLRARFIQNDKGTWEQFVAECNPQAIVFVEHCLKERSEIQKITLNRQKSLDISKGPLFATDLFNVEQEPQALLLSAHHLVVDLVSWRIIWQDLQQYLSGGAQLPRAPISFRTWCGVQQDQCRHLLPKEVLPATIEAPQLDYWGLSSQSNTYEDSREHTEHTDTETTTLLLGRSNAAYRTEPMDILLATLIHSFRQIFSDRTVPAVFLEGHGRESTDRVDIDLSETVGWFTTLHPIQVNSSSDNTLFESIRLVKDLRRQVPGRGQPYHASRYYNDACQNEFKTHDIMELVFNFAGLYQQLEHHDSLFQRDDRLHISESVVEVSPMARRVAFIVASATIERGETILTLEINNHMSHQIQLQRWSKLWKTDLENLTRILMEKPVSFTPSDFTLLSTSYTGLEDLVGTQLAKLGIDANDVQDIYPCTPLQEGMILSAQKGFSTYANHLIWKCQSTNSGSEISPSLLETAWRSVTRRHSIFSTVFVNHPESGNFVQVLRGNLHARVVHMECTSKSTLDSLRTLSKPLFSAGTPEHLFTICRASSSGEVGCRLDISHALFDAASMPILVRDLARAYSGKVLPAAPAIRDLVQHLQQTSKTTRTAYWTTYLAKVEACHLPGFPLTRLKTRRDRVCGQVKVPSSAPMAIDEFCRRLHVTRSVFVQVAWALVLSYYTGMKEVCCGYLASGRDAPIDQIEELVAPLINMLVSRVDLGQPIGKVVETTQEHSIEHLAHQHMSLALMQHGLGLGRVRLFNSIITVRETHNYEDDDTEDIRFLDVGGEDGDEVRLR